MKMSAFMSSDLWYSTLTKDFETSSFIWWYRKINMLGPDGAGVVLDGADRALIVYEQYHCGGEG